MPAAPSSADPSGHRSDAAERGRLVLARQVLEKIASQAAGEVTGRGGRRGGLLGLPSRADSDRPRVSVDLTADYADLSISLGLPYPASLRQTAGQVREHVSRRVQQLSGVPIRRVDVDISWLELDDRAHRDRSGR